MKGKDVFYGQSSKYRRTALQKHNRIGKIDYVLYMKMMKKLEEEDDDGDDGDDGQRRYERN